MNDRGARERLIEEFEQEWRNGNRPTVATFVRERLTSEFDANISVEGSLVHELIAVDLEWRWKDSRRGGFPAWRVEKYWHELPSLGSLETIPMSMVEEEYRVRRLWGDRPEYGEFMARFPQYAALLTTRLAEVDRDLQAELGDVDAWGALNSTMAITVAVRQRLAAPSLPPVGAAWARFEEYLLHEMIGAGQMGRVYRATHLPTGEASAVKYLRKSFHRDRAAIARFLDEARVVAALSHPGLVPIQAVGQTLGGGHFLAMELLPGPDLAMIIAAGPVEVADALRWTCEAADAIAYANSVGVIHCDLKPGNLVLDGERRVRVTDFGLARTVDAGGVAAGDRIAGTAPYMAPEQVSRWWGTIGPVTDVYGLGAVLYALLTGRPPFGGTTVADVLAKVASGGLPTRIGKLRRDVSAALAAIVEKALSKSPGERYPSASKLSAALRSLRSV
ncbi:serine/threonine-protein kinase [Lacipirellula limnantheis]|uniref:Serine/threonine-protein kinase PrkC n=1 Tax=Lacipirellula limnantheis TaxID=2528024 RepID=A0A517TZB7_9BACT|nr:serine/threonine-protein kinase [Lacipirellula limnantheis]QDT73716.1 Serine/threonine-protein kinase PrkC [Lacipirellula limnantheis]